MRKFLLFTFTTVLFMSFTYSDSKSDYEPILMNRSELEKSINLLAARTPDAMDKIYVKDHFLLITEKYKGVHIYDNSTPASPVNIGFLRIPGCIDVAMKGSILYADNATDLVAINLSDLKNITICSRLSNALPEILPPGSYSMPDRYTKENRPENTVIVEWKKTN